MSELVKNHPNIMKEFPISKAHGDVLEIVPANTNREEDRHVHITKEVVKCHFEESLHLRDGNNLIKFIEHVFIFLIDNITAKYIDI